jgi:hypothetical protein
MPLIFPSGSSVGTTYQSGSSPTYVFNGTAWDIQTSNGPLSVVSASFATTASYTVNINGWSTGEATTITAVTTNPTKPTTRIQDYTRYKITGNKSATVQFILSYTSNTGFNNGSGQYIYKLPTGISFDTTIHPTYTGDNSSTLVNNATITTMAYGIPAFGNITNDGIDMVTNISIIPYSSTTYRVVYGWGTAESTIISSAFNRMETNRITTWQFDITTA